MSRTPRRNLETGFPGDVGDEAGSGDVGADEAADPDGGNRDDNREVKRQILRCRWRC